MGFPPYLYHRALSGLAVGTFVYSGSPVAPRHGQCIKWERWVRERAQG